MANKLLHIFVCVEGGSTYRPHYFFRSSLLLNNTLYINNKIKDYEKASLNTSDFS